jgi:hypothetical protein
MKNFFLLSVSILFACNLFAQQTETRTLPPFSKIEISSYAKVNLKQEAAQQVSVSSESLKEVEASVHDRTLIISGNSDATFNISIPEIERLMISGRGEINSVDRIKSDQLDLEISGNGKMNLDVEVKNLKTNIGGLGKISLSGSADRTDVDISGSGKVEAYNLKTKDCNANISGMGKCMIDVSDDLKTEISGSGVVNYKTRPKNLSENISGIGKTEGCCPDGKADTTRLMFGKSQVWFIGERDSLKKARRSQTKPIWSGFEMGINSYMNSKGNFDLPHGYEFLELREEKSISVGLNLLQKNIELGHSNVWFFTGLGITWNNYRFASNVTLNPTTPVSATIDSTSNIDHIKSKLVVSYLTAPFMIEAFTSRNPKKAFHIGAGALVGLRLMSHTKQKYEVDGETYKPKVYNDFGLNPFRLGIRGAVGFHHLNLYADYYFSTLFKYGRGPSLFPVNVGITLVGF